MPRIPFPETGKNREQVLAELQARKAEDKSWRDGRVFSLAYFAGEEAYTLAKEAYTLYMTENGLNPSVFPSLRSMESDVVGMAVDLTHGPTEATGVMTSGGTESIAMALYAAREYARVHRSAVREPEVIVPVSAHPAFDKAGHYLGLKIVHAPLRPDLRVDVAAVERLITPNTVLLVGSAPAYPQGVQDPISELSTLAQQRNLLLHVDACVGGFMLPFVEALGRPVKPWDFRVPGVTSISMDLHKYGYTPKGASLVLYRTPELRKAQFYVYTEWPGGIYASPSFAGTRPGGAIAGAWAVLNHLGKAGYLRMAEQVLQTTDRLKRGVNDIPGLHVLSDPEMTVFAIGANKGLDIFSVGDELGLMGWHLDRQQAPDSLHLTLNHVHCGIEEALLADLAKAVELTRKRRLAGFSNWMVRKTVQGAAAVLPRNLMSKLTAWSARASGDDNAVPTRSAAMYGMMGALPNKGDLKPIIIDLLDKLNSPLPIRATENDEAETPQPEAVEAA
jgi:glutamate/tyrosine decarboxylase-like PLP-dependent enzyme